MTFTRGDDPRRAQRDAEFKERAREVLVKHLRVKVVTARAVLFQEKEEVGDREIWIPKSQIRRSEPNVLKMERGDDAEIWIPKWLAEEKEFLYEG